MILDGKKEAALLREEIKKEIAALKEKDNKIPGLTVILIGDFALVKFMSEIKKKIQKKLELILKL